MAWWRNAVVYQIYPRSFADSDGDGVGDLDGVTGRLDHLADLGADAVWLSPFYPSPMADFGYDVADYTGVDPVFGDLASFDRMLEAAHARGIRVIVDWVPNHSSDRHPWFLASRSSRDDPKRDWYVWRDGSPDGGPPNGWRSNFARVGSAWSHDPATGQWYLHSFTPGQPDLNWANPEVREAMFATLRFWLDRGVDGFRIDVAHRLGLDPNAGPPAAPWDSGADPLLGKDLLRQVRAVLDLYGGDRMAVGEVYVLDQRRLAPFLAGGDGLHLAHNFTFLRSGWSAARFRAVVEEFDRLAPAPAWPSWCLNNHDHSRTATRYGPGRARAALLLVLGLRGTAFLFQGEELGLPDAEVPADRVVDVDGRDPERAPIPWEPPSRAGAGAGFTTGEPWLPLVADAERLAVSVQRDDPTSTLAFTRALIRLRRTLPAFRDGEQRMLDTGDVLAWVRGAGDDRALVAINMGSAPAAAPAAGEVLLSTDPARPLRASGLVRLAPDEGVVLRLAP